MLNTWGDELFARPHAIRRSLWQPWIAYGIYVGETISETTLTGPNGGHTVRKFERVK